MKKTTFLAVILTVIITMAAVLTPQVPAGNKVNVCKSMISNNDCCTQPVHVQDTRGNSQSGCAVTVGVSIMCTTDSNGDCTLCLDPGVQVTIYATCGSKSGNTTMTPCVTYPVIIVVQ